MRVLSSISESLDTLASNTIVNKFSPGIALTASTKKRVTNQLIYQHVTQHAYLAIAVSARTLRHRRLSFLW